MMNEKQNAYKLLVIESAEQIARLAALANEIWTEHYAGIIGSEQTRYMLDNFQSSDAITTDIRDKGYRYTVAEIDGRWLGYSATVLHSEDVLFLSKLYVHKASRGLGIGRVLFADAADQARRAGCISIELTVNRHNKDSVAVYKHLGCKLLREQRVDIGQGFFMDDFVFRCPLN
jgi:GNAT superfamily N-acetyltransferase